MKKVLIITYYWPPSNSAGVYRWLKITKYLKEYDYEPIVFTPENPEIAQYDESLNLDVSKDLQIVRYPLFDAYQLYKRLFGIKKQDSSSFLGGNKVSRLKKLTIWIRGNLFIPDPKVSWSLTAVKFLESYIKKNKIGYVITTGPPHSMHLLGLKLKKKNNIKWIADFRDPWTFIDFFDQLRLSEYSKKRHHKLEKKVVMTADKCVIVTRNWAKKYYELYGREFSVIYNGFDTEDFSENSTFSYNKLTIRHFGSVNNDRNPEFFWKSLSDFLNINKEARDKISIEFYGSINESVKEYVKEYELTDIFHHFESLDHKDAIKYQQAAGVLLLLINQSPNSNGIVPGKFYEYLGAQRPILCIGGKNQEVNQLIDLTNSGFVVDFNEESDLISALNSIYEDYKNNTLNSRSEVNQISQFTRKQSAKEYAQLLNTL
jgi:glycosyltransferase involved in cell wall biosynthesis